MSKIRIVNWLLTRRCNLKCDYCAITRTYKNIPEQYPYIDHYIRNEMTTERVINGLKKLKLHNPNIFHIFYGGEPMLRKDLPEIIKYCNENEIFYTIISNNTDEVQPLIKKLFNEVGIVQGFTSSVDPIYNDDKDEDRIRKSIDGLKRLKEMQQKGHVKDVVAEITVMQQNVTKLTRLIDELSQNEIYSDITFIDIAKNDFYDFSNVTDQNMLIQPSFNLAEYFVDFLNDPKLLIHMKDILLPKIFDILPSNMNCTLDKNLHNITIDADGTLRLCLRIRGFAVPRNITVDNLLNENYEIEKFLQNLYYIDKTSFCKWCNHTCLLMSEYIDNTEEGVPDLVHSDKRG